MRFTGAPITRHVSRTIMALSLGAMTACASANATPAASTDTTSASVTTTQIGDKTFAVVSPEQGTPVTWTAFGEPFDSFAGVTAISNGIVRGRGAKYQCTELAHRFVAHTYGFPTRIGLGMGHGFALAQGMADYFKGQTQSVGGTRVALEFFAEGESHYPPVVGSVISMHFGASEDGPGHVAILRDLVAIAPDKLEGTLFAQHGAIPYKVGAQVPPDTVQFTQNKDGTWNGRVFSPLLKKDFRVVGWTSAVVQS